ncbi:hypothetical protein [Gaoshiqia sediminis]|uniref:Uncharacterized protein n=1 Tax=Gaoshiqia sediminis TaxID=2986998 RepID=A0AA42C6M7_9BACT|nr:hypothetical protein [Gaoshiqia sediminis]MCW0484083.1 hypothetical protein [Gaoshiqia sediminis]
MELTKETLRQFLDQRPAISPRALALHAGLNENYINQLYNASNRGLTADAREKFLQILPLYGWK